MVQSEQHVVNMLMSGGGQDGMEETDEELLP